MSPPAWRIWTLKIDIQVLYPTLFLRPVRRRRVELALYRGYNRWLAHIWKLRNNRLPLDRPAAGAVNGRSNRGTELRQGQRRLPAVFMRGHEENRLLSDSSLFPLYREAERLDLPICVHAGTGDFAYYDQYGQDVFSRFKLPSVGALII